MFKASPMQSSASRCDGTKRGEVQIPSVQPLAREMMSLYQSHHDTKIFVQDRLGKRDCSRRACGVVGTSFRTFLEDGIAPAACRSAILFPVLFQGASQL